MQNPDLFATTSNIPHVRREQRSAASDQLDGVRVVEGSMVVSLRYNASRAYVDV